MSHLTPRRKAVSNTYQGLSAQIIDLFKRDGDEAHTCPWCEQRMTTPRRNQPWKPTDYTVEHTVHRSDGGTDALSNLVLVCRNCNLATR